MSVPAFVARFEEAWMEPRTKFPALFHAEGTLLQSGMERPVAAGEITKHQEAALALMPDLRVKARRWAETGDDVFIEWDAHGTFLGRVVTWSGASRFTLRDGLVVEEVSYFDTLPLRAAANPAMAQGDMVAATAQALEQGLSA